MEISSLPLTGNNNVALRPIKKENDIVHQLTNKNKDVLILRPKIEYVEEDSKHNITLQLPESHNLQLNQTNITEGINNVRIKQELIESSTLEPEHNNNSTFYEFCVSRPTNPNESIQQESTENDSNSASSQLAPTVKREPESNDKENGNPAKKRNVLKNLKIVLNRINVDDAPQNNTNEEPENTEEQEKIEELKSKLSFYKVNQEDKVEELSYTIYKCDDCDFVTLEQNFLKEHSLTHHQSDKLKCTLCEFETTDESQFKNHVDSCVVKTVEKKQYMCEECSYKTYDKAKFELHEKKHNSEYKVQCPDCSYKAKSRILLTSHRRNVHRDEKTWKCRECDFSTKYRETMLRHEKLKHNIGSLKEYKCDMCNYTSVYTSNLSRHKKMVHNDNFIFECDQCEFKTKYKDHIEPHVRHHLTSEVANFACNMCDYKTVYRQNLQRHKFQKHTDISSSELNHCSICDFKSKGKHELKVHMKNMHGNPEEQVKYKCKDCTYFSTSKRYLKLHMMRIHLDPELSSRYKCDICDTRYITKQEYTSHMQVRHDVKEFECADCGDKFGRKLDLIKHFEKKHKKGKKKKKMNVKKGKDGKDVKFG